MYSQTCNSIVKQKPIRHTRSHLVFSYLLKNKNKIYFTICDYVKTGHIYLYLYKQ